MSMRAQTEYIRQQSANISTDMSYLKQLAIPSNQLTDLRQKRANTIDKLAQLLKMKNSKFSFSQQTKQIGQQWIRKKGADLNPLMQRIKIIKKDALMKQQQKKVQSQCHFYIPNLSYQNQDVYIQRNFQYGMLKTVQSIMSLPQDKGNLVRRTLNRRRIERLNKGECKIQNLPIFSLQMRNPIKKLAYIAATKSILNIQGHLQGIQWSRYYGQATKQKFWQIITNQLNYLIESQNKNNRMSKLALASLKMVQNIYKQILPLDYAGILHYLTNNYLGKMSRKYDSDGTLGPIWGIAFLLYRAGRKDQFYQFLPNQQVRAYFQKADASIKNGHPQKFTGIQQTSDAFFNQLMHALKGLPKCQTEALSDPNTLDVVWIFLRNLGIFPQDLTTFENLRKMLYQSYKTSLITVSKMENLLYLLGYSQIVQLGPNQMMDQDDFLHFLIAIYHSPIYDIMPREKKQFIEKTLNQKLIQYIQQLLLQKKQEYIYYIAVMPLSNIPQQISSIIVSSDLLENINWKYLSRKLPKKTFEKLVHRATEQYASFHQNYLKVAKKLCELLQDNKTAIDFMLKMFIKSFMSKKINFDQLNQAQQFVKKLMWRDQTLKADYSCVFGFFEQFKRILLMVQQRSSDQIHAFLRQSKHILITQNLRIETKNALHKLMEYGGFQCYFLYIKTMIKGYEISLARMEKSDQLKQLQFLTLKALLNLLRNEQYAKFGNKQIVKQIITTLQNACK